MPFITRITVPISNYYRDDVYEAHLYFECENDSPSKQQVVNSLENTLKEYEQYYKEEGIDIEQTDEKEILDIINLAENWCYVSPTNLVMTNTFVKHPQFGKQPLSFAVIKPIKL